MKMFNNLSLSSRGIRYKLVVAFSLMSIIPILITLYLVTNYVLFLNLTIFAVVTIAVAIALMGFRVIKELIDAVLKITRDASKIAQGDLSHKIEVEREDEIGDLAESLRQITFKVRESMSELRSYGEKTKDINVDIHKRVLALSGLLQVGEFIASGAELDHTLQLITERLAQIEETGCAFLMLFSDDGQELIMKSTFNVKDSSIKGMRVKVKDDLFDKVVNQNKKIIIDGQTQASAKVKAFQDILGVKNLAVFPITLKIKSLGLLAVGNQLENFIYRKEELGLINVFVKQVAIAAGNEVLVKQTKKLEIKDNLTDLYNEHYIRSRLEEEIKRAITFQRPCSFVIFNIDNFRQFHTLCGEIKAENALRKVSLVLAESADETDKVARFGDDEFAMLLPEKSKSLATTTAEEIRKKIEFAFSEEESSTGRLTVSGGVSENPIDGITAQELITKALKSVRAAKEKGKNRIIS